MNENIETISGGNFKCILSFLLLGGYIIVQNELYNNYTTTEEFKP